MTAKAIISTVFRWLLLVITLILMALFCSCSASWHVRRAMKKDPAIFQTVTKIDTVLIKTEAVDTIFKQQRDTLIVYKLKEKETGKDVVIKYKWNTQTDSVFIEADCPDPEIITKTETKTVILEPTLKDTLKRFWWLLAIAILVIIIRGRRK